MHDAAGPGDGDAVLTEAGCIAAREEADELIRAAAAGDDDALEDFVSRRTNGEPLAWLTGTVTFCDLSLFVAPGVYVPRGQTEPLARRAATLLPPAGVAVDLCTGVGAIAAVMTAAVPSRRSSRPSSTRTRRDAPDGTASRCSRASWTIRYRARSSTTSTC